jgi:hypothetical protein
MSSLVALLACQQRPGEHRYEDGEEPEPGSRVVADVEAQTE